VELSGRDAVVRARLFDTNPETGQIENYTAELTRTMNHLEVDKERALNGRSEAHAAQEEKLRRLLGNRTAPLKELPVGSTISTVRISRSAQGIIA
jgi:hypothetical protein